MQKLTLTFDPVTQNQEGSSSHHGECACEVWKWLGKNCSRYRVHKVKRDGPTHALTHKPTHSLAHSPNHPRTAAILYPLQRCFEEFFKERDPSWPIFAPPWICPWTDRAETPNTCAGPWVLYPHQVGVKRYTVGTAVQRPRFGSQYEADWKVSGFVWAEYFGWIYISSV